MPKYRKICPKYGQFSLNFSQNLVPHGADDETEDDGAHQLQQDDEDDLAVGEGDDVVRQLGRQQQRQRPPVRGQVPGAEVRMYIVRIRTISD